MVGFPSGPESFGIFKVILKVAIEVAIEVAKILALIAESLYMT
jgi:hypothetical protein